MTETQIKEIFNKLEDHEKRLAKIEGKSPSVNVEKKSNSEKQLTLRELVKGKKFKNGQEQVATIVGYYEKLLGQQLMKDKIKEIWIDAKMINKFSTEFIARAKDTLIRVHSDGTCDLTQTGEDFFEKFLHGLNLSTETQ